MSEILAAKSVLIVAKKLDDLSQLRGAFAQLGATDISVASSANMATSMLRMRPFDLVVVDHILGQGEKTGAQVIEEATREGLRLCSNAYVLILPQDVREPPRDSIYCGADTYLSHPMDVRKVSPRIEKLLRLKQAVRPLENLIDDQQYAKALQVMPKLLARFASLELYLDRLKGRVLLEQENYPAALAHFSELAQQRDIDWALLGCGIACYHLGQYPKAADYLQVVLDRNPLSLEAYEWLSRVYRSAGRNKEAQVLLAKAAEQLPTAATIHSGLGNVATENNNWDVATAAFRNAVRYARHSCHQSENNYFGLARCLQLRLSPTATAETSRALEEAVRILENVVEEYFDNDHIRFRSRLMTAESFKKSGEDQRATSAARDAFDVYKNLPDMQKAEEMDNLLEGVEGTDVHELVVQYRESFKKKIYAETEWGKMNMEGMSFYRKGQFDGAFDCFSRALSMVQTSPSILLNLIQSGHEIIRHDPSRATEVLAICNRYWLQMSIGALNNKQQQRYRSLSERRAELLETLDDK